ncbi:RanGTP-binding protein-domain-containing protein [Phlyctochytrium arcticum]|nr:RanGTP-binding protein-domain-containing protein [Phlyctochytrium arcticum]
MDQLFASLAVSGASLVSKAAFSYCQGYAVKQISTYVQQSTEKSKHKDRLVRMQSVLERKLAVITPAIDMCEIVAARGNTGLEAVLTLSSELKRDLNKLGSSIHGDDSEENNAQMTTTVLREVEDLIKAIDDLVPYIQLAIASCGVSVQNTIPDSVSPSRLLQASTAVALASGRYQAHKNFGATQPPEPVQVGPRFPVRVYSLFQSSARAKGVSDWTWKEDYAKASVTVQRVPTEISNLNDDDATSAAAAPLRSRIAYELWMVEDLNDGRYHEETEGKTLQPDEMVPGKKVRIPATDIQRLYYTRSGNLLNIDAKAPVMVLKVVRGGRPTPSSQSQGATPARNQDNSRIEYLAFELYQPDTENEEAGDSGEDEQEDSDSSIEGDGSDTDGAGKALTKAPSPRRQRQQRSYISGAIPIGLLSVLEYILRLSALEVSEQRSHLDVPDEKLNMYLSSDVGGGNQARNSLANLAMSGQPLSSASSKKLPSTSGSSGLDSPLNRKPGGTRFLDRLLSASNGQE